MREHAVVGLIGTGIMGAAMGARLVTAGVPLIVHTRTPERAQPLLDGGARWADAVDAIAAQSDIVLTVVSLPADVRQVYLAEGGLLRAAERPRIAVDLTTSEPSLARELAATGEKVGVSVLDAPVSGGDVGAREGTLSIMVGGDEGVLREVRPLLEILGRRIVHQGGPGAGQHTKMVNQVLIASGMVGVCEGLLYAERAGLDPLRVIESVGSGAAGSWSINELGPRAVRGDFTPGFLVEHFLKDLGIALDEARRLGLSLPGLAQARELYEAVRAQGHARAGTQALLLALRTLNGLPPEGDRRHR